MRILYICRLFSGFEDGLKHQKWAPKGAPTIAHMMEHLDQDPNYTPYFVLTCKDYGSSWDNNKDSTIKTDRLNTPIHVLAGQKMFPKHLWKFREKLSNLRQLFTLWRIYRQFKPDLIYCDRVNILPATFFARFTKTPVIWRIMGILENMRHHLKFKTVYTAIQRFHYQSPFSAALCTLDGSGGGPWMDQALHPQTQKHLLINGIDFNLKPLQDISLPKDKIKVLFVGRLEKIKGIEEFLEAFFIAATHNNKLHAIIAGDGTLRNNLEKQIIQKNVTNQVSFLGSVTPAQLKHIRQNCDIYVSMNKQGNLSNVNLEALSDGLCVIIPDSQSDSGIDVDTDKLIPTDIFHRFGNLDDQENLVQAILKFCDEDERNTYKNRANSLAKKILPSWNDRIEQELRIYHSIISQNKQEKTSP